MEKSCENCRYDNANCFQCVDLSHWQPDCPTLERENAELKSALKDIIYSCWSGRVGHIGDCRVYTPQIDCKTIDNLMGLIDEGVAR
jgi:hypothetical protein